MTCLLLRAEVAEQLARVGASVSQERGWVRRLEGLQVSRWVLELSRGEGTHRRVRELGEPLAQRHIAWVPNNAESTALDGPRGRAPQPVIWALSGSAARPRVRRAARSPESQPREARAVRCGAGKVALSARRVADAHDAHDLALRAAEAMHARGDE